jgi:hypothetical protein
MVRFPPLIPENFLNFTKIKLYITNIFGRAAAC